MVNFEHLIISGQSLSVGWNGMPVISTVTENANARRIHPADGTVTAMEGGNPLYPTWQLPEMTLAYRAATVDMVGASSHGLGGASIAQLSKGGSSGKYEQAISVAGTVKTNRTALGDTYGVGAFHWVQGETDQNEGMPAANYLAALEAMIADYRADIPVATGQPENFPVILSQTSMTYNKPATVAIAQLEASRTIPDTFIACSHYHLPHYTDNIHLTNVGYYRLGEYHARALNSIKTTGSWKPLAPKSVTARGNQITIVYDVPKPPLVFDTTMVPAQPNMGFTLTGTTASIIAVEIVAQDTIVLTTDSQLDGPVGVGYASDLLTYGARGNVRDSEPATSGYDGTQLANWSLIFRELPTVPAGLRYASAAFVQVGGVLYPMAAGS